MSATVGAPWLIEPVDAAPDGQREHIQSLNRDHARQQVRAWIDAKKKAYAEEIAQLEARAAKGCAFCIGLPIGGGYDLKSGCGRMYGLIEDHQADEVRCPQCERVVASWN